MVAHKFQVPFMYIKVLIKKESKYWAATPGMRKLRLFIEGL
jgi:hypothetical protein